MGFGESLNPKPLGFRDEVVFTTRARLEPNNSRFRIQGLGRRVFELRVSGLQALGFRVCGLGFGVLGLGFGV